MCLAFRFGVQQATTERETSLCMQCSQAEEHTAFHSGHSAIFLGGNVLMTIIIYSEDVLNFLSQFVEYFEYHWKAQGTENCRKAGPSATT